MPRRGLAIPIVLVLLCVLGFVLRTGNAATVFVGDAVVLAENDPYYHLRRVVLILADWPHVPLFDPWIDYPHGAPIVFAPLFDFALATLARLAGLGVDDVTAVERMAALLPPLLGALTCLPVYALATRIASRRAGLLAALVVTLVPAHVWYSRLGFVDHHVAVTLLAAWLTAAVLRALDVRPGARVAAGPGRACDTALAAAVAAAGLLTWNGFLLPLAILDLGLAALFAASDAGGRLRIARLATVVHLFGALAVLPVAVATVRAGGAPVSSVTLSYLHVAVLGVAAVLCFLAGRVAARGWPLGRMLLVLGMLAVAGGALVWSQRAALERVLEWTLASDAFMSAVQESVPILRGADGGLDWRGPQVWMSRLFFAVPLLLVLLLARLARERFADAGRLFVLVRASALFILTLRQRRFGESFAPALAVLAADFLDDAVRRLELRFGGASASAPGAVRAGALAVVAVVLVLAFAPYYRGYLAHPDRLTALPRALAGAFTPGDLAAQRDSSDVRLHRALAGFAALAHATTPDDAEPGGAMNPWPLGHKLLHVARVPVTVTPFGSYVGGSSFEDWIDFFLASDEARALALLDARRSRWVVVDNDLGTIGAALVGRGENPRDWYGKAPTPDGVIYTFEPPLLRSLYARLTRFGGSEVPLERPDGTTEVIPALDHLRLVVDSASDDQIGHVKVWERVPGATLVLRGAPGAEVRLRYAWRSDAGRARTYEKTVRLDASGEARVVLPYSSERPDLGQSSAWRIESDRATREIRVAEQDVLGGREIHASPD